MTPTEAAAWLRHGNDLVAGFLATCDTGRRPPLWDEDVEAIRTLVELVERLEGSVLVPLDVLRRAHAQAVLHAFEDAEDGLEEASGMADWSVFFERLEAEGGTA